MPYEKLTKGEAKLFLFILHFPGLRWNELKKVYDPAERKIKDKSDGEITLKNKLGGQISDVVGSLKKKGYVMDVDGKYEIIIDALLKPVIDRTHYNLNEGEKIKEGITKRQVTLPRALLEKYIGIIQRLSGGGEDTMIKVIVYIDKRDTNIDIIFQHIYNILIDIRYYLETKKENPSACDAQFCTKLSEESAIAFTTDSLSVDLYDDCDMLVGKVSEIVKLLKNVPQE